MLVGEVRCATPLGGSSWTLSGGRKLSTGPMYVSKYLHVRRATAPRKTKSSLDKRGRGAAVARLNHHATAGATVQSASTGAATTSDSPATRSGTIGRNYTYQTMTGVDVFYDGSKRINPFMGAGALGTAINDFNNESFDHSGLGFVGGAYIAAYQTTGRPIDFHPTPAGTPRWGIEWKRAVARHYNSTVGLTIHGSSTPHPDRPSPCP